MLDEIFMEAILGFQPLIKLEDVFQMCYQTEHIKKSGNHGFTPTGDQTAPVELTEVSIISLKRLIT